MDSTEEIGHIGHFPRSTRPPHSDKIALQKTKLLECAEKGMKIAPACRAVGISRSTFYNWLKTDPSFAEDFSHSELGSIMAMEDALFITGMSGNFSAQRFFLTNRDPERWKSKVDQGVPDSEKLLELAELSRKLLLQQSINGLERPSDDRPPENK